MLKKTLLALTCALGLAALWAHSQTPSRDVPDSPPVPPTSRVDPIPPYPAQPPRPSVPADRPALGTMPPAPPTVPAPALVDEVAALMKALSDIRAERARLDKREQETAEALRQKVRERRHALRRLEEDLPRAGHPL